MNNFSTPMPDQSVTYLGLSKRSENALLRNGISTIWDLQNLTAEDIFNLRGIGTTCANEIIRLGYLNKNTPSFEMAKQPTITEYMEQLGVQKKTIPRNYRIFAYYYNNYPNSTYDELANHENITKARAGQIITKMLENVAALVRKRYVDNNFIKLAIEYAKNMTRIDAIIMNADKTLTGTTLAIIASKVVPEQISIYNNPRYLVHRWVVANKDHIDSSLEALIEFLTESGTAHNINTISESFQLSKALILDIRNIVADDETITLKSNHSVKGNTGEKLVEDYLEKANGPANISDIANDTGKTINQIRSYINRMNNIENVGQSVYVLKDEKFEEQSVVELAKKYLLAIKHPTVISKVISYIQKYKNVPEESIRYVLFDPNSIFEKQHRYMKIWIKDVPYKKSDDSRNYDIQIDSAVLWIFSNSDDPLNKEAVQKYLKATFDDKTTHNMVSIYRAMRKMTDKEMLRRVGDYNSGLYMKSRDFDKQILNDPKIKNNFLHFKTNYPYCEKATSNNA